MKRPVIMVMAAGMGSRYGGLKQMDPVGPGGAAILDYSLYDAKRAGFEKAVIILNRKLERDFRELVGTRIERQMEVEYAFQELEKLPAGFAVPAGRTKPWGTGHAVLCGREAVGEEPFAVINADDYYGPEAFQVIFDYLSSHAGQPDAYAMVGYRLGNTVTENGSVARGICSVSGDGYLEKVVERTCIEKDGPDARFTTDGGKNWEHLAGDTLVSMNFWGFQRSFLDEAQARFPYFLDRILAENPEKGEFFLPLLVSDMLDRGLARVRMLSSGDKWFGVTYREDKPSVVEALREKTEQGLYPENLWGV